MSDPSMDSIVEAYLKLRQEKDRIENKAKAQVALIKERMEKLENYVLAKMHTDGVTSYKTKFGSTFQTVDDYVSVADWDVVLDHVKRTGNYHILEHRVNKNAVKDYINNKLPIPPGVNYGTTVEVKFRKPAANANKD